MLRRFYGYEFKTAVGNFRLMATARGLYSLDYANRKEKGPPLTQKRIPPKIRSLLQKAGAWVRSYLAVPVGKKVNLSNFPIDWSGLSPFEKKVLRELRKIGWGRTASYQFLGGRVGCPQAARAVGQVLHANRLPLILPCHRVVSKNGGTGGFSKGIWLKKRLLKLERGSVDKKLETKNGERRF